MNAITIEYYLFWIIFHLWIVDSPLGCIVIVSSFILLGGASQRPNQDNKKVIYAFIVMTPQRPFHQIRRHIDFSFQIVIRPSVILSRFRVRSI